MHNHHFLKLRGLFPMATKGVFFMQVYKAIKYISVFLIRMTKQ